MARTNLKKTILHWFFLLSVLLSLIVVTTIGLVYQSNRMIEIHQNSARLEETTLDLIMLANEQIILPSQRARLQWKTAVENFKNQLLEAETTGKKYQYPQLFAQLAEIETIINMIQRENLSREMRNELQPGLISQIYNLLAYSRQIRQSARQDHRQTRPYFYAAIGFLSLMVLLSPAIILLRMRKTFLNPIQLLINATRIISRKDFTQPIPSVNLEEINQLAKTMNQMRITLLNEMALKTDLLTEVDQRKFAEREATRLLEQLKANQNQMIQMEKLSAMGVMVGGVAHELNNPLMGIHNYIEYSLSKIDNPKAVSILQKAMVELERIQHLVKNMLIFSRSKKTPTMENISLFDTVNSVVELMQPDLKKYDIELQVQISQDIQIYSSADLLKQVLVNLLSNARDALKQREEGKITINSKLDDQDSAILRISDNGCGIPDDVKMKIFDPFFTTKPAGEGTGLGLSISQELTQQLDTSLVLEDTSTKGTTFSIALPLIKTRREANNV